MKNLILLIRCFVLLCFLVGCSNSTTPSAKLVSPTDLMDKRIAVLQGSTHESYATAQYPRATVLQYKSVSDMLLAVKTGKADAAIYSRNELAEYMRTNDDLAFLGGPLYRTPVAIAFRLEDRDLVQSFNRFLQQIRSDGTYDDMIRRWMEQGAATMPPQLPAAGNGRLPLVAGILSDNGLPFIVMQDNRLIGFNIELMERFSAFNNRPVQYLDLEFGNQIAALAGRKLDMIATPLAITEERKKRVAFSDPYYTIDSLAVALKKNIVVPLPPSPRQ